MPEDDPTPDDGTTPGADSAGRAGGAGPAPDAGLPPPPPASAPLPPATAPAPPYTGWILPTAGYAGPRLELGSIIGRTFDTFGREWSLFLVLAVPAAVVSLLQLLITPTFEAQVRAQQTAAGTTPTDPWALFVVSVIVATGVGISALASVVAADRLWRGEPASIRDAFGGVVRSIPRAIPIWLLVVLVQVGIVVLTTQLTSIAPTGRPTAAAARELSLLIVVGLPVVLVAVVIGVIVQVRLSLALPVISLEEGTPGSVIPRTWRLTKNHAITLFLCSFVIGICVSLTAWGSTLFLLFGDNRVIAAIALALAELVTAPLTGIWVLVAWGDLVAGGRHHDSELMSRGRGRWATVAMVFGLGTVLLLAGFGVTGAAVSRFVPAT
jgi:hypothetical protein